MRPSKRRPFRLPLLLLVLGFLFACHLSTSTETEQSFTFPALADSVAGADHVTILLKDTSGHTLDVLFDGPVTATTAFKSLKAPHYQGGTVQITIEAKKDGQVIYAVKQTYDGDQGQVTHSTTVVARAPSVRLGWPTPRLREGDSLAFPPVAVLPRSLENPSVRFVSRDPSRLRVGVARLHALLQGQARLVVMLEADSLVRDSVEVEILSKDDPRLTRLTLSPKPLPLALRGPKGRFTVAFEPPEAKVELLWSALDSAIVSVSPDGLLTPHSEGQGRIVVASAQDPGKTDTAWVHVLPPQQVDSVRFEMDSLEVFVGGTPDSLRAQVHPPLAPPGVTFSLADRTLARIEGGKLEALIEGETWVHVRSVEDPAKRDSLRLLVFPKEPVDSVRVKPDTLRLFVKGPQGALAASIHPTTLQGRFRWSVTDPAIASVDGSGQVSPGSAGKTYVTAAARADASKRDSALLIVVKDTPRLTVGMDTVVPVGATVTHRPQVTQEYGEVVLFRWDLDGNGGYEDSSTAVPATLTHTYAQTQVYTARIHVRDSEGNDTTVFRKVSAVEGRVVQITSPKDSSAINQSQIVVSWLVDGEPYTNTETLEPGANTLTRSAKDAAGHTFSHSITVFLDQVAPSRPRVSGPAVPVNTLTPTWTWVSGGGGNGLFRIRLDDPDLTASVASPDTFFTAPQNLPGGAHTLYVQERDEAGNWSLSGSFAIRIDTTAPAAPNLSVSPSGATSNPRPTWSWTGGTGDAYRTYRFKLGDDDFRSGGKDTVGTSYQPPALPEGIHTLFVQVRDSAGNWSPSSSASVTVDLTPPAAPTVSVAPGGLTNDATPTWSWRRGTGTFRYKLNSGDFSTGGTTTTDTAYTPSPLGEGSHTLYVQERDAAGNWSLSGSAQVRLDHTPPTPPRLDSTPYSPLNSLRPRWTWRSGAGGAKVFRAKVDDPNLAGAAEQTDSSFTPAENLTEGPHTLYVQERDSAGNWSQSVQRQLILAMRNVLGSRDFFSVASQEIAVLFDNSGSPVLSARRNGVWTLNSGAWIKDAISLNSLSLASRSPEGKLFVAGKNSSGWPRVLVRSADFWSLHPDTALLTFDANTFSLFAAGKDSIYLAYIDSRDSGRAKVLYHDGTFWRYVNSLSENGANFGPADVNELKIVKGAEGNLFVALLYEFQSQLKFSVYRWKGGEWTDVSHPSFENSYSTVSNLAKISMEASNSGEIHIALLDAENDLAPIVMKFVGNEWIQLSTAGLPPGRSWCFPVIKFGPNNRLFLGNLDANHRNEGSLLAYINSEWRYVGTPGVTGFSIYNIGIGISDSGVPLVGFETDWSEKGSVIRTSFDP